MTLPMEFTGTRLFANPFMVCSDCGYRATGYGLTPSDEDWPVATAYLLPCRHRGRAYSICPTWSPVDGCLCLKFLGEVEHRTPDVSRVHR